MFPKVTEIGENYLIAVPKLVRQLHSGILTHREFVQRIQEELL